MKAALFVAALMVGLFAYFGSSLGNSASAQVPPSVEVTKECDGPGPDFTFTLTQTAPPGPAVADTITCGESTSFDLLPATNYTLIETAVGDWPLQTPVDCVAGIGVVVNQTAGGVTITTPAGADFTLACTFVNEGPDLGSITIVKDTNPETSGIEFDFDSDFGDFDLEDDQSIVFPDLFDTTHSFGENPPAGWEVVAIDCDADDYTANVGAGTLVVDLQLGEDVTCVFTNEEVTPDGGTIIIEKDVNPEPDTTHFSFSDTIPNCNIGTLADDGAGGLANSTTCVDVPPGGYTVSENVPATHSLVDIDCDDFDGGTYVDNYTVYIDLDPGETVHCVFTNVPDSNGSITITKDTNPETDDVFFGFDSSHFGSFDLEDDESMTFYNLNSGSYQIWEYVPGGWFLDDIICSSSDVTYTNNSVTVHLDAGEHVSCEFVNAQLTFPTPPTPPTPTRTPVPQTPQQPAPPTPRPGGGIQAPSAGDGGLLGSDSSAPIAFGVLAIVAASGGAWIFLQRRVR